MGTVSEKIHQPCPDCGSSDALTINTDGSTKCYSCGKFVPSVGHREEQVEVKNSDIKPDAGQYRDIVDRRITLETCRKYGVKTIMKDGGIHQHIYPYANSDGELVAQKIRTVKNKSFITTGQMQKAVLFGQDKFPASGKSITVTEGELDAMACYQMMGSKFPVVSIPFGAASSERAIKDNYKYLDAFEQIILCWDGDDVGQKAVKEIAAILPPNKVKIVKMPGEKNFKDPCDFLRENKSAEFINLWWRAEEFRPEGLINLADMWERVKDYKKNNVYIPTGIKGLDEKIIGFRDGQVIVTASGTGMGKTAILRKLLLNLLASTELKIGTFFLEEITEDSAISFLSNYLGANLKNPKVWEDIPEETIKAAFEELNGGRRIEMYDGFDCSNVDNLESNIRYLAKARDCKVMCVDHITMIVDDDDDVRRALNKLMRRLKNLAIELKIIIIAACHLRKSTGNKTHEEGGRVTLDDLKDSSSIKQLSDIIIGLERNQQAEDEVEANTTKLRVLKNRDFGDNGLAAALHYNKNTTQFEEVVVDLDMDEPL